jgi:uncharacterized protein YndB with AHSA1/START domain
MEATAKILNDSKPAGTRNSPQPRGYDILHRVGIDASPDKVFAALTTLEGLRGWWTQKTDGNPALGGRIDFFGGVCDMDVVAAEPGKRVKWLCTRGPVEWVGTEVTFVLEQKRDQTFVLFSHSGWKEQVELMHHCSTKWATFLMSLREYVERGAGRPAPNDVKIHVGE